MCTYATVAEQVDGSAKGPGGQWFHVTDATVYYDHPVHAMAEHTLNIDLADPSRGPGRAGRRRAHPRLGHAAGARDRGSPRLRAGGGLTRGRGDRDPRLPRQRRAGPELAEAVVDAAGLAGDRRKKAAVHVVAADDVAPDTRANLVVSLPLGRAGRGDRGVLVAGEVELDVTGTARNCPGVYAAVRRPGTVRVGDVVTAVGPVASADAL